MPVSFGNKQASIFMADPCGDGFEVDILLNRIADKVMPHAVMGEVGQRRA